jgi:hypothetical protein
LLLDKKLKNKENLPRDYGFTMYIQNGENNGIKSGWRKDKMQLKEFNYIGGRKFLKKFITK